MAKCQKSMAGHAISTSAMICVDQTPTNLEAPRYTLLSWQPVATRQDRLLQLMLGLAGG